MAEDRGGGSEQTRGFLFADLRGYTDFVERRGDSAAAALLERYRVLVRNVVARQQGAEIRTEGDSFFVLFPSASRAVTAALEIVDAADNVGHDDPRAPIRVGVGVHAGETAELPEGPVGSAVNVAARICAQARAGEVLVSDTVRGLTRTRQVATFVPAGSRRLKGIAEPIALYRALPVGATSPRPVITTRLGRPASSSWLSISIGALVIGLLGLVGIALYNGMTGPGASATPESSTLVAASSQSQPPSDPPLEPGSTALKKSATPTFSPASEPAIGTRIVFSRQHPLSDPAGGCQEGDGRLYVLNPDSPEEDPYRLTGRTDLYELLPEWMPDQSAIIFAGNIQNRGFGIFSAAADGGAVEPILTPTDGFGFFSVISVASAHDGSAIVYTTGDGGLWRTDLNGSNEAVFIAGMDPGSEDPAGQGSQIFDAVYLPDGQLLVLVSDMSDGTVHLETMEADGTGRSPLDVDLGALVPGYGSIALAPDGDTLALQTEAPERALYVGTLSAEGADLERVAGDAVDPFEPEFSPDGKQLAFQAGGRGNESIQIYDLASRELKTAFDPEEGIACSPTWAEAPENLVRPPLAPEPSESRPFERGYLEPGRYLLDLMQPNMEMTFDEGWHARRNYADGWSLARVGETLIQEVDAGRITVGLAGPCPDSSTVRVGATADDVLDWLESREDLSVTNAVALNVGGFPAIAVDVAPVEGSGCEPEPGFERWTIYYSGQDTISFGGATEVLRLVAIDVPDSPVAIQVFSEVGHLDDYWSQFASPLLETISFPNE